MEEKLIIFISSRINDEMKRARRVVREAIEGLPLTRAWLFEEAPAAADRLDESYLRWVGKCDLFVMLLGEDITDPLRTEWETATQAGRPRLVFLKKGAQQDDAAREFARGLDVKWKEYRTLAELKREVQAAVGDELIKGFRAYGVSESERAGLQERVRDLRAGGVTIGGDVVYGDKVGGDKVAGDKIVVSTQVRDVRDSTIITAGRDVTYTTEAADDLSETSAEQIRNFRTERLSKIMAGETLVPLIEGGKIVLHIIPARAFDVAIEFDVASFADRMDDRLYPINTEHCRRCNYRVNFDGFLTFAQSPQSTCARSYLQLFRNGGIEAVEAWLLRRKKDEGSIPSPAYEQALLSALPRYLSIQKDIGVEPPLFIMLSLLGVCGYIMAVRRYPSLDYIQPIDRDALVLPEVLAENFDCDPAEVMKPAFDAIWNAAGWPRSMNYDETGKWVGQ